MKKGRPKLYTEKIYCFECEKLIYLAPLDNKRKIIKTNVRICWDCYKKLKKEQGRS